MRNSELVKRDLAVLWHPCTQMKDHETVPLIPIRRGKGVWLEDFEGKKYLDAISSWWVNLFGHSNPVINNAITTQLNELQHTLLAGFTHEPAISLSEQLVDITPQGLNYCLFADNGSCAVEMALKLSYHYWQNRGKVRKKRFVTLANSYHGETLGALSVGNVSLYKQTYASLLFDVMTVTSPDCYYRESGESCQDYSRKMFSEMIAVLDQYSEEICAVIVEPLVQCAGSMRMYDPIYLSLLKDACTQYNVHLIADEIAVGFGRTGSLFACEQANISPDIMCLSKGITGGYMPLSTVLCSSDIYETFYKDYSEMKAFLHSHSYTGNALACAAALATLDIFKRENVLKNNLVLSKLMENATKCLLDHAHVSEVRQKGMILAIELVKDKPTKTPFPWQERRGLKVYQEALSRGVILRPLGDIVYFMPPYIITEDQINLMVNTAIHSIDVATRN